MCLNPITIPHKVGNNVFEPVTVTCGKCVECLKNYSNEWALRCEFESRLHKDNCFLTLTYANEPLDGVCRRDLQLFLKRLRKQISPVLVRFFGCGEYGEKNGRAHYHLLLFGWKPSDLVFYRYSKHGQLVYKSQFLNNVWKQGFVWVEDGITFKSAVYSAKYLQKLLPTPEGKAPAFTCMSTKPAIGWKFFENDSHFLSTGFVFDSLGRRHLIPKYFVRKSEALGLVGFDVAQRVRKVLATCVPRTLKNISIARKKYRAFVSRRLIIKN